MKVIKAIDEIRQWSRNERQNGHTIGFVPTMGYLHEGHLSLVREAQKYTDRTVVSIYVNPTQFAPNEDLEDYPRDFGLDASNCRREGVDALFYPNSAIMYPQPYKTYVVTEDLSEKLCGRSRPIHFRGVTTVVSKLLNIVEPHVAVFGQKDAQQAIIVRRMVKDLNFDVEIIVAPTVRESDGLAMSSRNKYLSQHERKEAPVLYRSLQMAESLFNQGRRDYEFIKDKMSEFIRENTSAKIDYIEFVDAETLEEPDEHSKQILAALAAYFNKARLIDNIILNVS